MVEFNAYHGKTSTEHQQQFNTLSSQGYRIISLSIYGAPEDPRYAAVWIKRAGSAWRAIHGVNADGYQSFFNTWTAQGYVPAIISATGSAFNAIFAAVFERGIPGAWSSRHGLTSGPDSNPGTFQHENSVARSSKMILRSFAVYGTSNDRRYAGIWHANPGFVKWHIHPSDTGSSYQTIFNEETQLPGYRLAYISLGEDQVYCSIFKDDVVGQWVARHGMSAADYQVEFNKQTAAGFYPICIEGGGSGSQTRYAAIFAKHDIPFVREWTITGPPVASLAGFDHLMQGFMQANAIRTGQLTISKNGVIKLARAYTWAEPGYRITQPSDRFLLASCSKMFLEAAVQSLYDKNPPKLTPTTKVYPLIGFSQPADPRSDTITIQQLLDHTGGYDDTATGSGFDPTYKMRKIALDLQLGHAVSKLDVARYMYNRPLDFTPGTNNKYSNFGYLLASVAVEHVTGMNFFDYLKDSLLQPANITEVEVWPTVASPRPLHEVIHEDENLGLSAVNVNSSLRVPYTYGGDGEIKEVGVACAGLAASATAMTQFIHLHKVWGNGPRPVNGTFGTIARAGSTPGTSTWAESRGDGIDWALTINTRNWPPVTSPTLSNLEQSIDHLLDTTPMP